MSFFYDPLPGHPIRTEDRDFVRKLIDALPEDGWDQVDFRISPGSASCDCGDNRDICVLLFEMYNGGLFTDWASAVPPDPHNKILGGIGVILNRDAGIDGATVDYEWYVAPAPQEEAEEMAARAVSSLGARRAEFASPFVLGLTVVSGMGFMEIQPLRSATENSRATDCRNLAVAPGPRPTTGSPGFAGCFVARRNLPSGREA